VCSMLGGSAEWFGAMVLGPVSWQLHFKTVEVEETAMRPGHIILLSNLNKQASRENRSGVRGKG
jgi:hypothetical protein